MTRFGIVLDSVILLFTLAARVRDLVVFGTRKKKSSSQRRVLRSYGAKYRYLPGGVVDEGAE